MIFAVMLKPQTRRHEVVFGSEWPFASDARFIAEYSGQRNGRGAAIVEVAAPPARMFAHNEECFEICTVSTLQQGFELAREMIEGNFVESTTRSGASGAGSLRLPTDRRNADERR